LPVTYSTYAIGAHGEVLSATIQDGAPRTVNYVEDASGQVIRRRETSGTGAASTGTELSNNRWYRFAGVELFESGSATTGADGIASASYTVREGDTLVSIASSLWGDGALWYKLAEANGLTLGSALIAGRTLSVPGGVSSTHHNADTFKPYDTVETLGNTQPGAPNISTPAPPRKKGCGVFGQVISTIVAVAASYFLGPVLGNVVSQGFNNIIGTQSGFSWKSLGMSVITAGVTSGLDGAFAGIKSAFLQGALQQGTASVLTQGIGVATGLQKKFDFVGIAAAALSGGLSKSAEVRLSRNPAFLGDGGRGLNTAGKIISNTAGALAEAGARSVLSGTSFGDNLIAVLPSVIGRAAADGLGAKPILGDGWLGRLLTNPGEAVLGRGWITDAANTVGNVIAEAVKSRDVVAGGGGHFERDGGGFRMKWVSDEKDFGLGSGLDSLLGQNSNYTRIGRKQYSYGNGKIITSDIVKPATLQEAIDLRATVSADSTLPKSIKRQVLAEWDTYIANYGQDISSPQRAAQFDTPISVLSEPEPPSRISQLLDLAAELKLNGVSFNDTRRSLNQLGNGLEWLNYAVTSSYDRGRNIIDANTPKSGLGYYIVQNQLAPSDFARGSFGAIGKFATGTVRFAEHPWEGTKGSFWGIAQGIDAVLVNERTTSALQNAENVVNRLKSSSIRDISTATGSIVTNGALLAAPFVKGPRGVGSVAAERVPLGFNRSRITQGFQDHHILSDKNPLTMNHELLDLSGYNLQSRSNKIFLPETAAAHPTRSIHQGRHLNSVSENFSDQMTTIANYGRQQGWSQAQYRQALDGIVAQERALLRSGDRALNRNAR
jgi:hypothetical protein